MVWTCDIWTLKDRLLTLYCVTPVRLVSGTRPVATIWTDECNCLNLLHLVANFRNYGFASGAENQPFALLLCLCVMIVLEFFHKIKGNLHFLILTQWSCSFCPHVILVLNLWSQDGGTEARQLAQWSQVVCEPLWNSEVSIMPVDAARWAKIPPFHPVDANITKGGNSLYTCLKSKRHLFPIFEGILT